MSLVELQTALERVDARKREHTDYDAATLEDVGNSILARFQAELARVDLVYSDVEHEAVERIRMSIARVKPRAIAEGKTPLEVTEWMAAGGWMDGFMVAIEYVRVLVELQQRDEE